MQAYRNAVKAIDAAFARKIAVAKVTFRKALRGAHTSADQVSARAKFRLTIADAISSRETELGDLGDPPGQTLAPVVDQSNAQLTGM